MTMLNTTALQNWIGKSESRHEILTQHPLKAMSATLNKALKLDPGSALPPLWHWLYFLDTPNQAELAEDGHAKKGNFLPPVDLPRRMWAGSRIEFMRPLIIGDAVERTSTIKSIEHKQGRTGSLAFVCVEHLLSTAAGVAVREEHDIVYRASPAPGTVEPAPVLARSRADFSRRITPDPVLLFRYSALTFNGHRIHYDRDFATQVEGYPGLVVHGPLLATLMVDLLLDSVAARSLRHFEFKAVRPVFDLHAFTVCATRPDSDGSARVWVQDANAALCMHGSAMLENN